MTLHGVQLAVDMGRASPKGPENRSLRQSMDLSSMEDLDASPGEGEVSRRSCRILQQLILVGFIGVTPPTTGLASPEQYHDAEGDRGVCAYYG